MKIYMITIMIVIYFDWQKLYFHISCNAEEKKDTMKIMKVNFIEYKSILIE